MSRAKASLGMVMLTAVTIVTLFLLPYTPRVTVRTHRVQKGRFVSTTLLEGTVRYLYEEPCIAVLGGRVAVVHVRPGDTVSKGQLLFSLDTTAEQRALAVLVSMKQQAAQSTAPTALAAVQTMMEGAWPFMQQEAELRTRIECAQIRAGEDGVVSGIYVEEGDLVGQAAVLGLLHGFDKAIVSVARANETDGFYDKDAALLSTDGEPFATAALARCAAPTVEQNAIGALQQLTFTARSAEISSLEIGSKVLVEIADKTLENEALLPLAAIDTDESVWIIKDGVAWAQKVEILSQNDEHAIVRPALDGQRVVLWPQQYDLRAGVKVREAKGD